MQAEKGKLVSIYLHGHDERVEGTVVEALKDGFIKAVINDATHPLCHVDNKPRVLTVSPEMYELL
jgi:hypothetical protein